MGSVSAGPLDAFALVRDSERDRDLVRERDRGFDDPRASAPESESRSSSLPESWTVNLACFDPKCQ